MVSAVSRSLLAPLILALVPASASATYLNFENISVALGPNMAAEPFANRTTAASLASVIDAPSADASEDHTQSTHVWVQGATLELDFDFGVEHDLTTLHFWNYYGEGFDVDNIDITFFDASMTGVGELLGVSPALGGAGGNPIFAEDIDLDVQSVRFANFVLSGSNNQIDFNNIGFTSVSTIPEPSTALLLGLGLAGLGLTRRT